MSKVGNQTNSQDPQAVNSRAFVGNLNTFQCTKTDVERMFQRYGKIAGISMHKGYAFVQFTNPFDARSACIGEDGRNVFGQILDVNLVAEPKPHQIGRKRPALSKTGADWEQFYDSYNSTAAALATPSGARIVPPVKRMRLASPGLRQQRAQSPKKGALPPLEDLRTYSSPDILICGNCREMFSSLHEFVEHRRQYCKLRFTCKCSSMHPAAAKTDEGASLMCAMCKENFGSAWDLMVHAQAAHMVNIYQLATKDATQDNVIDSNAGESTSNSDAGGELAEEGEGSFSATKREQAVNENGLNERGASVKLMNGGACSGDSL